MSIFLYACESWTLTAELHRRMQAMEMRYYHNVLPISYKNLVTNEEVRAKILEAIRPHKDLLTIKETHIRSGQSHLARCSERGRKARKKEENVERQHQGMDSPGVCQVPEGSGEQRKTEETGCEVICGAPTTLAVKG